jgi:hypothetical protein
MKIIMSILSFIGLLALSTIFYGYKTGVNIEKSETSYIVKLPQNVRAPKLGKDIVFAGEAVPINIDTKERLEKELLVNSYYHSSTILALKLSTRYFPMMERILKEEGISDDFKYLAVAESTLANVTSPAGAKGIWQFMPATAKEFGLEVNADIDQRFDVEKSTRAACKYIKGLYKTTGSWTNAAAAYNVGPGRLKSTINSQGEASYYDMNLNAETSRYLFRIIALKEIMTNPESYGYLLDKEDYYQSYDDAKEVKVTSSIVTLSDFAKKHGVSYRLLKVYNPWMISERLPVSGKPYSVKIPQS